MLRKIFILSAVMAVTAGGAWVRAESKSAAPAATTTAAAPATSPTAMPTKEEIKSAIKAGNHQLLAQYYKDMAAKERADAAMHEEMAQSYKGSYVHYKGMENTMPLHCDILKDEAMKKAKKYDEMAKDEEKLTQAPAQK